MKTKWFEFKPDGPHNFSRHVQRNAKGIKQVDLKAFKKWLKGLSLGSERGVYFFATGAKKPKPWYVGRTTAQDFAAECGAKEAIINKMVQIGHGDALLFVLRAPASKSAAALDAAISDLETEMIRSCYRLNVQLLNDKKKHPVQDTFVPGVLRSGAGKPTGAAAAFRTLLKIT